MLVYPLALDTVAKFREARHKLAVHCPSCFRWAEIDLAAMIDRDGDQTLRDHEAAVHGLRRSGEVSGQAADRAALGRD
jgi:hypothetical protein